MIEIDKENIFVTGNSKEKVIFRAGPHNINWFVIAVAFFMSYLIGFNFILIFPFLVIVYTAFRYCFSVVSFELIENSLKVVYPLHIVTCKYSDIDQVFVKKKSKFFYELQFSLYTNANQLLMGIVALNDGGSSQENEDMVLEWFAKNPDLKSIVVEIDL